MGLPAEDVDLVFVPEDVLHRVPFGMLRCASDETLFSVASSVSVCISMASFKRQVSKYLWDCRPFLEPDKIRLAFFGVPTSTKFPDEKYLTGILTSCLNWVWD